MKLFYWDIIKLFEDIFKELNIEAEIKYEAFSSYAMSYNAYLNKFTFNDNVIKTYFKAFKNFKKEKVIKSMIYHEIGHYIFHKKHPEKAALRKKLQENKDDKEYKLYRIDSEQKAWDYGKEVIPKDLFKIFDKLNKFNMDRTIAKFL